MRGQGDIKLNINNDGGEIDIENGDVLIDVGFETAIALSLYGTEDNNEWMNEYLEANEKIKCECIPFIKHAPKTLSNIQIAKNKAESDLSWFIDDKIADKITIEIQSTDRNSILLYVGLFKDANLLYETQYSVNWEIQIN